MANYTCAVRTNYFHVKDEEAFRTFAEKLYCNEGDIEVWEDKDKSGKTVFGFGCCNTFCGIKIYRKYIIKHLLLLRTGASISIMVLISLALLVPSIMT